MAKEKSKLNVSIIGGGLVGSICACFTARRGFNVTLYEYRDDIRSTKVVRGRSINLAMSARGRAALRSVGLEEHILKNHAIPMRGRMIHDLQGNRRFIPYDSHTNQCIYSVGRKYLNEVLLTAAEKYENVKLYFNHKLVNARPEEGNITLMQTRNANKTIDIKSDLIIGADGAYSSVRRSMMKQPLFDFNQTYIEHGYMELSILPINNEFAMEENFLHIWPRGEFMMIALPNQDRTWTVTLFMPFSKFKSLDSPEILLNFFYKYFPDSVPLIGEDRLVQDFFSSSASTLISIKCSPYHVHDNVIIIGDAAHAMVPFYGQGMNAGFEDCSILDELLDLYDNDIGRVLPEFSRMRNKDGRAICDLAMYNYIEMRDLVNHRSFSLRKKLDDYLFWIFPDIWVPLYNSVSFTGMGYEQCASNKKWQDKIIVRVVYLAISIIILLFSFLFYKVYYTLLL